MKDGRLEDAREVLTQLIDQVPDFLTAHVLMAQVLEARLDYLGAYPHWQRAAILCPENKVIEKGLKRSALRRLFDDTGHGESSEVNSDDDERDNISIDTSSGEGEHAVLQPDDAPSVATWSQDQNASTATDRAPSAVPEFENLDKLILELESARIVPNPDIEMIPDDELETEIEDVVSETLARIYAHQKYFLEAADVYEKLADQEPDKAEDYRAKAAEMRGKTA